MGFPVVGSVTPSPTLPNPMCATTSRASIFQTLFHILVPSVLRFVRPKSRCRTMPVNVKWPCNKTLLTPRFSFKGISRAQRNSSNLWSAMTVGYQPVVSAFNSPTKQLWMLGTTSKASTIQTHSPTTAPNAKLSKTPEKLWRFTCESVRHESAK